MQQAAGERHHSERESVGDRQRASHCQSDAARHIGDIRTTEASPADRAPNGQCQHDH